MTDGTGTDGTEQVDLGVPGVERAVEIGVGGFGKVYRAHQPTLNRTVAVKVLNQTLADDQARLRFDRECRAMGMLSGHPNIVTIFDSGVTAAGQPYLVMDFQAGGSYADRLDDGGPLAPAEVAALGVQAAGALATAHQAGILHRDLKPENIMISRYGEPQVGDFGIARLQGAERTQTGVLTASFAHIPPELLDGHPPSAQTDVYSFGSTLFTLLWGRAPYQRGDDDAITALMARVLTEAPPDLREHGVPDALAALVERCLAKKPDGRPQSMVEVGRALQTVQRSMGQPVSALALAGGTSGEQPSSDTVVVQLPGAGADPVTGSVGPAADSPPGEATVVVGPPPSGTVAPAEGHEPATPDAAATSAGGGATSSRSGSVLVAVGGLLIVGAIVAGVLAATGGGDDPGTESTLAAADVDPTGTEGSTAQQATDPSPAADVGETVDDPDADEVEATLLAVDDLPEGWETDDAFAGELRSNPSGYLCGVMSGVPEPDEVATSAFRGGTPGPRVAHVARVFPADEAAAFMDAVREQIDCLLADESLTGVQRGDPTIEGDSDVVAVSYLRPGASSDLGVQLVFSRDGDTVTELVQLAFPDLDVDLTYSLLERLRGTPTA